MMELHCSFSHILREQNTLVDELENWGVGLAAVFVGVNTPF